MKYNADDKNTDGNYLGNRIENTIAVFLNLIQIEQIRQWKQHNHQECHVIDYGHIGENQLPQNGIGDDPSARKQDSKSQKKQIHLTVVEHTQHDTYDNGNHTERNHKECHQKFCPIHADKHTPDFHLGAFIYRIKISAVRGIRAAFHAKCLANILRRHLHKYIHNRSRCSKPARVIRRETPYQCISDIDVHILLGTAKYQIGILVNLLTAPVILRKCHTGSNQIYYGECK